MLACVASGILWASRYEGSPSPVWHEHRVDRPWLSVGVDRSLLTVAVITPFPPDENELSTPGITCHAFGFGYNDTVASGAAGDAMWTVGHYRGVQFHIAYAIAATAVPPVIGCFQMFRTRQRRAAGLCARCGYNLRASPGRCPECGAGAAT
jgi:hypothetical protein